MTSHTVFVVASFAFHVLFASSLEVKRVRRIMLSADDRAEDTSEKDVCSACEADVSNSWAVKCQYKTCGLCTGCNSDKTEDKDMVNSEEMLVKGDTLSVEEDKTNDKICSACEADVSASWDTKCSYKTCGLCTICSSDKTKIETIENSEEIPMKIIVGDATASRKEDSHEEDGTNEKLCSACEADIKASWAVKCTYKSCGLCPTCNSDKTEDPTTLVKQTLEDATQCQSVDGKMYNDGDAYECTKGETWQCAHGEWEYVGTCDETEEPAQCQGGDGKTYENGATSCTKGETWKCANGEWQEMGACDEAKEETVEMSAEVGALAPQAGSLTKPKTTRPLMYVAEGCDGSTASTTHAVRILALHGIDAGEDDAGRESLIGKTPNSLPRIKSMYDQYKSHGMTLLFKSILHRDMEATTSTDVANLGGGTLAVYVTRRNHLDQVVCMIRDCFVNTEAATTVYGYAVKSDGTPSNLCFERRETEGDAGKAKLRVKEKVPNGSHDRYYLEESLQKAEQRVADGVAALKKAGYNAPKIASEDLEAFQAGGDKNLETSLKAWTELLKAWEVEADTDKLTKYLSSYANTWSPKSQKDTIDNYDEVVKDMKRMGKSNLLRYD